jgi:hypothetical protein
VIAGVAIILMAILLGGAVAILGMVLAPALIVYVWRAIYPLLVRMGRWAAQLRNLIALLFAVVIWGFLLGLILGGVVGVPTLGRIFVIVGLVVFFFLFLLGVIVWLVRLWRYIWPRWRNGFWDICARIAALIWLIILGVVTGVAWLLYHPLRWVFATILFYLRLSSRGVAWLLRHPPLRWLITTTLFFMGLIARPTAWLLYHPPIRWLVQIIIFFLRLIARICSVVVYAFVSLFQKISHAVTEVLQRGLATEKDSYQEYQYAHNSNTSTT